jgi:hypothetical protein
MNENKESLKAMALIAAELHIQNLISIAKEQKLEVGCFYVSAVEIPKLVDHFLAYFEGGRFNPLGSFKFKTERKRRFF